MKSPRNKIIECVEKFVGEEKDPVDMFNLGYNNALQDLRSKIPQLADEMINIVIGEIKSQGFFVGENRYFNKYIHDIIKSLTQDITNTERLIK